MEEELNEFERLEMGTVLVQIKWIVTYFKKDLQGGKTGRIRQSYEKHLHAAKESLNITRIPRYIGVDSHDLYDFLLFALTSSMLDA
ncbi:hypothetical protein Tco_1385298 [Tanacetum coccineum]